MLRSLLCRRIPQIRLFILSSWLLILLVGCNSADGSNDPATATPGGMIAPPLSIVTSPTALATSPTIIAIDTTPPEPTAKPPPSPTPAPMGLIGEGIATTRGAATPPPAGSPNAATPVTATPSPVPPTFTPPPPPPPVEGEHLLLPRPVPAGGVTWTDKSYPYGSTRGGTLRPHTGVEFFVPSGTPALAVAPGVVVVAGDDMQVAYGPQPNFYGNLVIVEMNGLTDGPLFALYGHLSEVTVQVGQPVAAGDTVGLSGESGVADGPHLHFELRFGENSYGATRNPLLWLKPLARTGVVAGRVLGPGGELLREAPVSLLRVDGRAPYTTTTSYADGEPNPDDILDETFVLDDVEPGYHEVVVDAGRRRYSTELWVFPDRVNWVEITLSPAGE